METKKKLVEVQGMKGMDNLYNLFDVHCIGSGKDKVGGLLILWRNCDFGYFIFF